MFDKKGVVTLPKQDKTEDEIMEIILDAGAEDLQTEEEFFVIQSSIESFETVRKALQDKELVIDNASLQWIPQNYVKVTGEDAEKVAKLLESLEDCDDVQNVYSNADIDEASINN